MNIIVVGNTHRKSLISDYLKTFNFSQYNCEDYDLPEGWVDKSGLNHTNPTGVYRAFRGHQDALGNVRQTSLVFEDDAVPHTADWPWIVLRAFSYLDRFDWISLHGREFDVEAADKVGYLGASTWLYTVPVSHINGCCMAYWMKKRTATSYRSKVFDGHPVDWVLWSDFKAAIVHPSPFIHDRSQGSLIDIGARV